jgi:hypothetical protein
MVRVPQNAHVLNDDQEYKKIYRKLIIYTTLDAIGFILAFTICVTRYSCFMKECTFPYIFVFYICSMVFNMTSLIMNIATIKMIKNRYVKIWVTLASLIVDTFLFAISVCALFIVVHFENYDHEHGHPVDRNEKMCECASENLTIVPIIVTCFIQVMRSFHVFVLVLYLIFVFPCTFMSDSCWIKPKCLKNQGASRSVLNQIQKVTWKISE